MPAGTPIAESVRLALAEATTEEALNYLQARYAPETIRPDEVIESGDVQLRPEGEVRVTRREARLRVSIDTSPILPPLPLLRASQRRTAWEAAARALWDALNEDDDAVE